MKKYQKILKYLLIILDIITFYISILILVFIRYGIDIVNLKLHFIGFSIILPLWILIFYINNLYNITISGYKNYIKIIRAYLFGFVISIIFFYFIPYLKITPKINLILFIIYLFSLSIILRKKFEDKFIKKEKIKIIIIAPNELKEKILEDFKTLPLYEIKNYYNEVPENLDSLKDIDLIIVSRKLRLDNGLNRIIKNIGFKIPIIELLDFYEQNFNRVILEEIDEYWILKEIIDVEHKMQTTIKRIIDLFFAFIFTILLSILFPFIALLIIINSGFPIFFLQKRVGKDGKEFILYKFKTMKTNFDQGIWAKENDERVFFIGKILRRLHLDELPQVINIFKGELSFVGPRPEQVNIVKDLENKIKFFNIRHLVQPGITGWAQINYKYAASIEESIKKLEYDLYYLKNKSLILDILIVLKTIIGV